MRHDKLTRKREYAKRMYKARTERPTVRSRLVAIRFTEDQYHALKLKFKKPSTELWKLAVNLIKKELMK